MVSIEQMSFEPYQLIVQPPMSILELAISSASRLASLVFLNSSPVSIMDDILDMDSIFATLHSISGNDYEIRWVSSTDPLDMRCNDDVIGEGQQPT